MGSRKVLLMCLFLALTFLIASEVSQAKNEGGDKLEDAKYGPGGGGSGYNGGGGGGYNRGGGGGYNRGCRFGCCRRNYYGRGCDRCCRFAGEVAVDVTTQSEPHN